MKKMKSHFHWVALSCLCWMAGGPLGACSSVSGQGTPDDGTETETTTEPTSTDSSDTTMDDSTTSAGDGDGDQTVQGGPGLATLGEACGEEGSQACAGTNQLLQLTCTNGKWVELAQCQAEQRCDSRPGHGGQCQAVVEECLDEAPGTALPLCNDNVPQVCGADLVTVEDGTACGSGEGCLNGVCEAAVPGCPTDADAETDAWACSGDSSERIQCGPNGTEADREACASGLSCVDGDCGVLSCGAGLHTCGPDEDKDCCERPLVSGGTFFRGVDEAYPATVSDFQLDKYEVTVSRFRQFQVAWDAGFRPGAGAGKHRHLNDGLGLLGNNDDHESGWDDSWAAEVDTSAVARGAGDGLSTFTSDPEDHENLPINFVNWYEAFAFCIWDGGFLPSEAEWEYAAAGGGGTDGERPYPWGETEPTCDHANHSLCDQQPEIVGSLSPTGDGRYGQSDLAGNLDEWVQDFQAESYDASCVDCVNTTSNINRVLRGGYFDNAAKDIASASRSNASPANRSYAIGVRCARVP